MTRRAQDLFAKIVRTMIAVMTRTKTSESDQASSCPPPASMDPSNSLQSCTDMLTSAPLIPTAEDVDRLREEMQGLRRVMQEIQAERLAEQPPEYTE